MTGGVIVPEDWFALMVIDVYKSGYSTTKTPFLATEESCSSIGCSTHRCCLHCAHTTAIQSGVDGNWPGRDAPQPSNILRSSRASTQSETVGNPAPLQGSDSPMALFL